ncbi:helix-turn-helix domain-containing protein [Epibacterium sp. DP7N7-1]|nr:helix-turn-helix domain-containing protein [Epibacterium sp. DP7N7-1]
MTATQNNPIQQAVTKNPNADKKLKVQTRGRPERDPFEAAQRILRRQHFGRRMRELREGASLTLSGAASMSGMTSPRKLSQYETTCYPPGEVVVKLAPLYGVTVCALSELVLSHSDPALFEAMTGRPGYEPPKEDVRQFVADQQGSKS